jgi:hypothetical protein
MKTLELKNLGVQEMNTTEMTQVEGGGPLNDLLSNTVSVLGGTVGILATNVVAFAGYALGRLLGLIAS